MIEFPKMLYRPRPTPNEQIGGLKLDTKTVDSSYEQEVAEVDGWITPLAKASAILQEADTRYSELVADIDASIRKAYDANLAVTEQKTVREHLAYALTKLREPNSQIEPAKAAIAVLDSRMARMLPWFQRPFGVVILAVIGSVIAAGIAKKLGWI